MLIRFAFLLLTVWASVSFAQTSTANAEAIKAIAEANKRFAKYEKACADLARNVSGKLAKARKLAPLVKESVSPDMDYCHEDLSQCDLRTLVFKDFTLRLLHHKPTQTVSLLSSKFRNERALERFCGPGCSEFAEHDEEEGVYIMDCQQNI